MFAHATALVLMAALALPALARASTVTWTYGTQDTDHANTSWYDPGNWSPQQVPRPEDDVVIPIITVPFNYAGGTLRSISVAETGFAVYGDINLTAGTSSFSPWTTDVFGTLTVSAAATLVVSGDYNNSSGPDTVVNYGTIVGHDVGYPHPSIGAPVYNHGTVTCDAGTLCLYQGGVSYTGSAIGGGAGTVQLFDGSGYVVDWTLHGGCALVGGVELADLAAIPVGATVECSGSNTVDLYGGLFGPGTLRVEPGSTLALGGGVSYDAGFTLDNDGTVVVNDCGPDQWHGGTLIDNSGVLHIQTDHNGLGVDTSAGRAVLLNTGTIVSDGINPYVELALDNRGTISSTSGRLNFTGGTSAPATGAFVGTAPGEVAFANGEYVLADGATLSGTALRGGTLTLQPGATVPFNGANTLAGGTVQGAGTALVPAGSSLLVTWGTALSGGLLLDQRGTLEFQGDHWLTTDGGGAIANSGTITKTAGAGMSIVNPTVTNSGTISVLTGWITLPAGKLTNYSAATKTLTGGTYQITAPGRLCINDTEITTLAANVELSGETAKIEDSSANNALRNLASVTSSGYLGLDAGQALTTAPLTNQGQVWIGASSTLTATNGAYTQAAGQTVIGDPTATLAASGTGAAVRLTGGFLSGCGTVGPSLANTGGYLKPEGATPCGTLSVAGPYSQGPGGTVLIDIAGTAAGSYDRLAVSGAANLGGQLVVTRARSYMPAAGDSFAVVTAGSRSGTFAKWRSPRRGASLPAPFSWEFNYSGTGLTLVVH